MNTNILKTILFIPIIGKYFYYDINWLTVFYGSFFYIMYTFFYKLSFNNIYFAMSITPNNYSESYNETHKIISYFFSTLHSLFISLYATLYLCNMIDNYTIKQSFFISMSYYLSDLFYVIDSTQKLKIMDYFMICHHNVMIIMYYVIFIKFYDDIKVENTLLYYMNRGLLAEYSVLTLNYSWYLVNTKQDNSNKMLISSILTLILYFIVRVINFTRLIFNFWYDDLIPAIILMMPLFLVNYYWFYKLICKAKKIYINNKNN